MMRRLGSILLLAALCLSPALQAWAVQDSVRRFALVVGANNGGKDRGELRYAVSDARGVMSLLLKIGGVFPIDSLLVIEPNRASFLTSMEQMRQKLLRAKGNSKKLELIVYYSGHSDEEGLLLGRDRVYYKEIRQLIANQPADVRITILDSCSSGAFTRIKGGKLRSPFLENTAYNMKGYAVMTSSSSDESSQESDRLRSSFFTHYLVAGLRGAADMTGDGCVSLNEAYQYAYNETLSKTEKTLSGPQHPNYDIQMAGTGDVMMTDIRTSSAILLLDKNSQGRFFIRDYDDNLVVELRKPAGREVMLGLEAGDFTVTNERDNRVFEAQVRLELGQQASLPQAGFREHSREHTVSRGNRPRTPKFEEDGYEVVPWSFSVVPEPDRNRKTIRYYVLNLFGEYEAKLDGISFGIGPSIVAENARGFQCSLISAYVEGAMEGVQVTNIFNFCGGPMRGCQLLALANINNGDLQGVQAGSVFNYQGGPLRGGQAASVLNIAAQDVTGVQVAGVLNIAKKSVNGVQASLLNLAGDVDGVQASLVNVAGDVNGVQAGLVNIAKRQNGTAIGLVSLADNGEVSPIAWYDNLTGVNAGFKFRVNHVYSVLAIGSASDNTRNSPASVSFHIGGYKEVGSSCFLEADLGFAHSDPVFQSQHAPQHHALEIRGVAGWRPAPFMAVFAGVGGAYTFNIFEDLSELEDADHFQIEEGKGIPLYLGGIQFTF